MPYFYKYDPITKEWLPTKELNRLLEKQFPPPKQHGKRKSFNGKRVKNLAFTRLPKPHTTQSQTDIPFKGDDLFGDKN